MLIFGRKHLNPFSKVDKLQIFSNKYFATWKISINRVFLAKKQKGWSHKLEIFCGKKWRLLQKISRKWKICECSPSLWKWGQRLKIEIFIIFSNFYYRDWSKTQQIRKWEWENGSEGDHFGESLKCKVS